MEELLFAGDSVRTIVFLLMLLRTVASHGIQKYLDISSVPSLALKVLFQNNVWEEEASLNVKRQSAAAIRLSDDLWWITGGHDPYTKENHMSTELYYASRKQFELYVDLPRAMYQHNMVKINQTTTLVFDPLDKDIFSFDRYRKT